MQAVLLEHDTLSLTELAAVIISDGKKGHNLIREYDQGMRVTLQRPIYDPPHPAPGMVVGIDVPSIKATLSELEYRLTTSIASDNMSEPTRIPFAGRWLHQYYQGEPEPERIADQGDLDDQEDADQQSAVEIKNS